MAGQGGQGLPPPQQRWKAGRMAMKMPVAGRPAAARRQPALVLAVCSFPPSFLPSMILPSWSPVGGRGRRSRSTMVKSDRSMFSTRSCSMTFHYMHTWVRQINR